MSRRKYDYEALKTEFLAEPTLSVRELCRRHEIAAFSTVYLVSKREKWEALRADLAQRTDQKSIAIMSRNRAQEIAKVQDNLVSAINATIYRFIKNLESPDYKVHTSDIKTMSDILQLLNGKPTSIEETHNLNLEGDADGFRLLLDSLRARSIGGNDTRPGEGSVLPALGPRRAN